MRGFSICMTRIFHRLSRFSLAFILATSAFLLLESVDNSQAQFVEFKQVIGVAQGDSLNIRSGPGRNFADVGDLQNRTVIRVLGYDPSGRWAKIRRTGRMVWVSTKYLADVDANPDLTPQQNPERFGPHLVTAIPRNDPDGGLVLRSTPNLTGRSKAVLPLSTPVEVKRYSADGKWCFIHSSYGRGWVRNKHLVKALPQNSGGNGQQAPQLTELSTDPQGRTLPYVYRVTGVAQGDKLWVRNQPHARSAPVNNRAPGQRISVLAWMSNGWAKVSVGQNIGYVNGKFLTRKRNRQGNSGFPQGLTCAGTEPFWTLTFNSDQSVTYKEASNANNPQTMALQVAFPDPQSGAYPYTFRAGRLFGLLDQKLCSDGMSDIQYGWTLQGTHGHPNGTQSNILGCCRLP